MTSQVLRSSRAVCSAIAEGWRKRKYPAHFASKLTDAESEAEETRVWLEFAADCEYLSRDKASRLDAAYDLVLSQLVTMRNNPEDWAVR